MVAGVLAIGEISLDQDFLQRDLAAFLHGPEQKAMGIEGVIEMTALFQFELKTDGVPTRDDHFIARGNFFGAAPIFAHHVLDGVLALGRHVRVQFERLEGQLHSNFAGNICDGLFQRCRAECAPGAHHIRHKVDPDRKSHFFDSVSCWRYSVVVIPA
ncbi:hypothetical protein QE391_001665 [Pseudomonas fluorescens]|nr:hypothetical protein [Pseudomonas fluorescens]